MAWTPTPISHYVHEIDHSPLEPNPALGAALEKLPGRKLILTNGTKAHADAVMRRLAIHHHFEDVFDIVASELQPKPFPENYDRFPRPPRRRCRQGGDVRGPRPQPRRPPCARHDHGAGGAAEELWVAREGWELEGRDAAHVDYVTDDLAGFLEGDGRRTVSAVPNAIIPGLAAGQNPESSSPLAKVWIPGSVLRTAPE